LDLKKFKLIGINYFKNNTVEVARNLLDCYLITDKKGVICGGRIVETEAYLGFEDKASHASVGPTRRNSVMFGPAGYGYVYLIYGLHCCFNIVCEKKDVPGAVLIRAIEPEIGVDIMKKRRGKEKSLDLTSGPAKLTQALGITLKDNGKLLQQNGVLIMKRNNSRPRALCSGSRIGITKSIELNYRFYIKDSEFVS